MAARRRWTEREILDALGDLFARGVPITVRGLVEAGQHRLAHAVNHFGGLRRARRLAGLPPPRKQWRRNTTDAPTVLREIKRRDQHGEPLASSRVPQPLRYAAERHFGSWRAAVAAAGIDYARVRLRGKP